MSLLADEAVRGGGSTAAPWCGLRQLGLDGADPRGSFWEEARAGHMSEALDGLERQMGRTQSGAPEVESGDAAGPTESDGAPLMRAFMEQLFRSLREDFTTLKQEIVADIKDLIREVIDLGQHVDTIKQTHDAQEEEMDCHRRELLNLQDKNQDLQYQIEDLENKSRCSNIRIKGVPTQAVTGSLEDFVVRLFHHVAPALKEQKIVLDRTHRAGRPARAPGKA
ncbi:hypothetical protein NDU88_005627 [Pleurodeles waltl]|uniref:Uncharacterized protein n=1 Tax=Pleurodeles waltl TaxID=8319 RepID=A0AAV7NQT5_PLEWA|nr:hypothetical protein NDU88_005627 [Pleurodeles waltl]